jgi:flagellar biosynthesis/type III secretory pathway chaperone
MTETLREFVERRLLELMEAERPLVAQLNEIRRERKELERTSRLVWADGSNKNSEESVNARKKTIKEAVVHILGENKRGMTALEILRDVNNLLSSDYQRTSLSPQLSRLKKEGKVVQSGIEWLLPRSQSHD